MSDTDHDSTVRGAFTAAAATGPLAISPIPGPDTIAVAGIWGTMMVKIARRCGHEMEWSSARKFVLAVISGAGAYWIGSKWFGWILAKVPGIGTITGSAINSALNAGSTLWLGFASIDLFEKDDYDPDDWDFALDFVKKNRKPSASRNTIDRVRAFFRRWREDA